jgi:HrpA-like RNA helicase
MEDSVEPVRLINGNHSVGTVIAHLRHNSQIVIASIDPYFKAQYLARVQQLITLAETMIEAPDPFKRYLDRVEEEQIYLKVTLPFMIEGNLLHAKLPVYKQRELIELNVNSSQTLIIVAETGSGKSTQLPQILTLMECARGKPVVCTQPRKIAALGLAAKLRDDIQVAHYIVGCFVKAAEFNVRVRTHKVIYCNENSFLNRLLKDIEKEVPLEWTNVLILDEVHERSLEADIIMALVKLYVLPKRPDLKLIVTSATMHAEQYSHYFNSSPILTISGRQYPITSSFIPDNNNYFLETVATIERIVIKKTLYALAEKECILVFLTGFEEINKAEHILKKKLMKLLFSVQLEIKCLSSKLDFEKQAEILDPERQQCMLRVVLATNIAETSITIPYVTVVIDSCREKRSKYRTDKGFTDLSISLISKENAIQRRGRCGRVNAGDCFHILSESEFEKLSESKEPAILRSHLGIVMLKLLKYGIQNLSELPLIDMPSQVAIKRCWKSLIDLEAVQLSRAQVFSLTEIGQYMANLELDPELARFLYEGIKVCRQPLEFLVISSFLKSVTFVFEKQEATDETLGNYFARSILSEIIETACSKDQDCSSSRHKAMNSVFFTEDYLRMPDMIRYGELVSYLFIYKQWQLIKCFRCLQECLKSKYNAMSCDQCCTFARYWCFHYKVTLKSMLLVKGLVADIQALHPLRDIDFTYQNHKLVQSEMLLASLAAQAACSEPDRRFFEAYHRQIEELPSMLNKVCQNYKPIYKNVAEALCHSLFTNLCILRGIESESSVRKRVSLSVGQSRLEDKLCVLLHPSSLYLHTHTQELPTIQFMIYGELVKSSQCFIKHCCPVDWEMVKRHCSSWLQSIGFNYENEVISEYVFENLGPSILQVLAGNHFRKAREIEESLNAQVVQGCLLLVDHDFFCCRVWAPRKMLESAVNFMSDALDDIRKALHMTLTIHVTIGRGSILLVVEPGCIVKEVIFSRECLMYKMVNLPRIEYFSSFESKLKAMFNYKWVSIKRRLKDYNDAYVYFNTAAEAEIAVEALKLTPVLNSFGRPIYMEPILNLSDSAKFSIRLHLPVDTHDSTIIEVLEFYGKVQYYKIMRFDKSVEVTVRFRSPRTAKTMLSNYPVLAKDLFGREWPDKIWQMNESINIPTKLIEAAGLELRDALRELDEMYGCDLRRVYCPNSNLERVYLSPNSPRELSEQLSMIFREDLIYLGNFATQSLFRGSSIPEDRVERTFTEWQQHFHVKATLYQQSNSIGLFGLPECRKLARVNLENYVKQVNSTNTTKLLTYDSTDQLRAILSSVATYREGLVLYQHNPRSRAVLLEGSAADIAQIRGREVPLRRGGELLCSVCLMELSLERRVVLEMCGHKFHKDCLKLQLSSAISNRLAPELPVSCILCHTALVPKDWLSVLEEGDTQKLYQCAIDLHMTYMPHLARCENRRCFYVYNRDELAQQGESVRDCPECNMKWCTHCLAPVFTTGHDIACQDRWLEANDPDTQEWVHKNTVNCPQCGYPSLKGTGCNHMTCTRCRGHYCYLCGLEVSSSDPNSHFMQPGTECFGKLFLNS